MDQVQGRAARLAGLSIVVVEDDFYVASDLSHALGAAGARVIGPFARFDHPRDLFAGGRPDCAVIDINLGSGIDFAAARFARDQGVPVIFVTGYDRMVIPRDLARARHVLKPACDDAVLLQIGAACGRR